MQPADTVKEVSIRLSGLMDKSNAGIF
jgi:hypothetical protein